VGTVQAQAIMSLDGYVAKQDNTIGRLFDWLQNGEVAIPTPAGDFAVHLTPPSSEHCLELGLLDEVAVDLVPVVMGEGNRPFFGELSSEDVMLGNPTTCVQGDRVTHLVFPVPR
jgi:hypothetical protein